MIMGVGFCLSYDLYEYFLNAILSASKFSMKIFIVITCNRLPQEGTCSRRKCYVTYGQCIIYPLFTNYRCILIIGVFRFLQMTLMRYYHSEFSTQHCLQCIFLSSSKKKKAEMSFLRVSDLLLVCVVLNHDADSSLK